MTSPAAKGSALELRAKKELEAAGWAVERARGRVLWIPAPELGPGRRRPIVKAVDFFGAFDLHGVSRKHGHIFIQVCADSRPSSAAERRRKIEAAAHLFPERDGLELWRWRGGRAKKGDKLPRGWVKERYSFGGWRAVE